MRSGEAPVSNTLPLLCALGRHKTDGLARWNAGYYFARCTRCRRDLVRTAFTRWQIPKGFRVVWQDESSPATPPAPELARESIPQGQVEFPIRDDARFVDAGPVQSDYPEDRPEPVMAEPETDAGLEPTLRDEDAYARVSAAEVPLEDILRSVPGLADDPTTQGDARRGEGGWFAESRSEERDVRFEGDEARFEEENVRFAPSDRLIDFASAEQVDPQADGEAPEELAETVPDVVEEPPPPAPPVKSKYPVVPDFMDESSGGIGWEAVSGRIVPRVEPAATSAETTPDLSTGVLSKSWQDLVRRRAQKAGNQGRDWLRGMRASKPKAAVAARHHGADEADLPREDIEPACAEETVHPIASDIELPATVADAPHISLIETPSAAVSERTGRFGHFLMNQGAIVAATIFGGLVLAASVIDSRNGTTRVVYSAAPATADAPATQAPAVADPRAPVPRSFFTTPRAAFVTASILKCRSTPSNDADTLRKLERGAPVRVLGTNPGWSSIAHQGRQCWVATQHLSATRPV